jgi:hypothetical protein
MTVWKALALYAGIGAIALLLGAVFEGQRGLLASAVAWSLCLIVFLGTPKRPRVAAIPVSSKISRDRRVWLGAMPIRMLVVLGGSAWLYRIWGDRLSLAFWIAVPLMYMSALALSVAVAVRDIHKTDQRRSMTTESETTT